MTEFICYSLEDTKQAAIYFAQFAKVGQCFALHGDLGSGKTTFAGDLIKHLNPKITSVSSPTFTIIQTYPCDICDIWHADCYRLKSEDEFYELGLNEAFDHSITIIEWPEIIHDFLPNNTINIFFEDHGNYKKITADCIDKKIK